MKWRNHAALLEIGASPREVDATPSHSLSVSSSCFPLLINKRIFFHLSTTLYPTDRLTSSASSASSRFLSLARVGLYFEVSTKNPRLTNRPIFVRSSFFTRTIYSSGHVCDTEVIGTSSSNVRREKKAGRAEASAAANIDWSHGKHISTRPRLVSTD